VPRYTRPETVAQREGEETHVLGAVVPPIFQNSLFVHETWESFEESMSYPAGGPYNYSRLGNPTLEAAERKIAALEGCDEARLTSSGMAAVAAGVFSCVGSGSHVVCVDSVYGPTRKFLTEWLARFGVGVDFVVGEDPQEFVRASRPETALWYLESPASIVFRLQDLTAVAGLAQERGVATMIDNSYASPVFQQPHRHGVALVMHTVSKYLGGHSDVVGGVLCGAEGRMRAILTAEYELLGSAMSPFNAWLVNRSMRTLTLRMRAVQEAGNTVARWLEARPEVTRVHHVGLGSFPQAELRDRQMSGTGGLLSFEPRTNTREWCKRFTESLRLYRMGVSWGGHESLAVALECKPMDWPAPRWLVRLYNGLEHPDDLLEDLDQAFRAAG
jgi:cystathionine beta-lyase/cystathionine gamma-synthase